MHKLRIKRVVEFPSKHLLSFSSHICLAFGSGEPSGLLSTTLLSSYSTRVPRLDLLADFLSPPKESRQISSSRFPIVDGKPSIRHAALQYRQALSTLTYL